MTWLATRLRWWADRIDPEGAPRATSWSFTFERGVGVRHRQDGRGCQLWYLGYDSYDRAHTEADDPAPRVDWSTMTVHPPGTSLRRP